MVQMARKLTDVEEGRMCEKVFVTPQRLLSSLQISKYLSNVSPLQLT